MRHPGAVLFATLLVASCTGPSASRRSPASARAEQLLDAVEVTGPVGRLSDADRLALESAAARVLAAGPEMVTPLLNEIRETRDPERRAVLTRILYLMVDRMRGPVSGRDVYYREIEKTARGLLASRENLDRYTGFLLICLPHRSQAVPTAIGMLEDEDEENRNFAIAVLKQISAMDQGFRADGAADERRAAVRRWRNWWRRNRKRDMYYQPAANPVLRGLRLETTRISRTAGPYPLEVRDADGNPLGGTIVAYSYHFSTPDGIGKNFSRRTAADGKGKVLLASETVGEGMRFVRAELIVSKMGYRKEALALAPHFITPNSFSITVTLAKE